MATLSREVLESANHTFKEMEAKGKAMLQKAKATGAYSFSRTADMRYVGQGEHFSVSLPEGSLAEADLQKIQDRFHSLYYDTFGYRDESQTIEIVNWRMRAYCPPPPIKLKRYNRRDIQLDEARKENRKAFFPEFKGFVDCVVYDRYKLFQGAAIKGPAIVVERDSTAVILPGDRAEVDEYGNLMIAIT
jgi:N-methylhydantoinase A